MLQAKPCMPLLQGNVARPSESRRLPLRGQLQTCEQDSRPVRSGTMDLRPGGPAGDPSETNI